MGICGYKYIYLPYQLYESIMNQLLGEFQCRLDEKGRLRLPSSLLKQLGDSDSYELVMNRGEDKNLNIYPKNVWDKASKKVNKLNTFKKKNRAFARFFYSGASELTTDSSERILIPKVLMEWASIKRDVVLFAFNNKIELWSAEKYEALLNIDGDEYSDLAEEVMGDLDDE